jgi:hypothetical protein
MSVVRQLAQAILVLGLFGCVVRLLHAATSNPTNRHQEAGYDTAPIWVRDQQGGGVLPGGDVGGDRPDVMVTYSYYAAVDDENPAAITVERETEYLVCTDAANQAAQDHLVCEEPWAGRPPWTPEHQEGPR